MGGSTPSSAARTSSNSKQEEFTNDAALIFYGASMLLKALRGYGGCEVLAVSNWLLRRDDQVGCAVFWPIDRLERPRDLHGRVRQPIVRSWAAANRSAR
jgi:hypothetical protein